MRSVLKSSIFVLIVGLSLTAAAAEKKLVNKDADGFALQRYDAVTFFTEGKAVKGNPQIQSLYQGARYVFSSVDNKKLFDREPEKYAPQYGGYCAYGMAQGHPAPVQIDTWQIINGRLMLNYDSDVRKKFDKDHEGYIRKADENWPKVVEKEGK
jgi:YHS domain-containing protein